MFPLTLMGARGEDQALGPLAIPADYQWTPDVPPFAQNVAQAYARLADDLRNGTIRCPTFNHAVKRHRLIDAIERSAASGSRVTL